MSSLSAAIAAKRSAAGGRPKAALGIEAIAESSLELWELPLYWMARLERRLPRPSRGWSRRSRIFAYLAARGLAAGGGPIPGRGYGLGFSLRFCASAAETTSALAATREGSRKLSPNW